jgi:hypothetical protein
MPVAASWCAPAFKVGQRRAGASGSPGCELVGARRGAHSITHHQRVRRLAVDDLTHNGAGVFVASVTLADIGDDGQIWTEHGRSLDLGDTRYQSQAAGLTEMIVCGRGLATPGTRHDRASHASPQCAWPYTIGPVNVRDPRLAIVCIARAQTQLTLSRGTQSAWLRGDTQ